VSSYPVVKPSREADTSGIGFAIIVPAYNEAESISDTIADIRTTMASRAVQYSLILVDDGSTDETASRLVNLAAKEPESTKIVTHPHNLGLGRAIVSGYAAASAEWVGWLPADGQFCAEDLYELYASRGDGDAVLGRVKVSARERADNIGRVVVSWMSRAIMRVLHPRMPRFNGIMVVRRNRITCDRLVCRTGFVNMEILDRLRRAHAHTSITERHVRVLPRRTGHSKVANLYTTLAVLRDLWTLRVNYLFRREFNGLRSNRKPMAT